MNKLFASAITLVIAGCATQSSDLSATYVSPLQYQSYDCDQLGAEVARVHSRIGQVGGRLDQAASSDKGITAAGAILFWPALFFLGGTRAQEAEYSRLKGEYDAIQQAAIQKRCSIVLPQTAEVKTAP